jgi:hypothetical protein
MRNKTSARTAEDSTDLDGVLDAALEIAARRRECMARLKKALDANNTRDVVRVAKELCGYEQAGNSAN